MKKLKAIFLVSVPVVAVIFVLLSFRFPDTSLFRAFFLAIGSSLLGSAAVLCFERLIVGDPLDRFCAYLDMLSDSRDAHLLRVITDRNSFLNGPGILSLVDGAKKVKIQGTVLGFVAQNERMLRSLQENLKSGGTLRVVLLHPSSSILRQRDEEENWGGTLTSRLRATILALLELKSTFPSGVGIYLFKGECHNTVIATEKRILVSPYAFGEKGWILPILLFERSPDGCAEAYCRQIENVVKYAEKHAGSVVEIKGHDDMKREWGEMESEQ